MKTPCLTCKKTRLALGTVVLCAAFLLTAWNGNADWLSLMAFGVLFGLPEAADVIKAYLKRDDAGPPSA